MARATPGAKIGPTLRRLRLAAGMTQTDLADVVNVAPETLSRIETSRARGVSLDLCRRLASGLGVDLATLFEEAHEPKPAALRPGVRALLALAGRLDQPDLDDLLRMLRLVARLGRRLGPARSQRSRAGK